MGFELVGIEQGGGSGAIVLRLYIDHKHGVSIEDCSEISHQISGVLDVEDPIFGKYTLEVSSPGLDRPLFKPEDFDRFCGKKVRIVMQTGVDGRRKFAGELVCRDDNDIVILMDGTDYRLSLFDIDSARLVPEF